MLYVVSGPSECNPWFTQIEGAILETWLPGVFQRLEELARLCRIRCGAGGGSIEGQELDRDSSVAIRTKIEQRRLAPSI
jgi:hypothetical protein